MVAYRCPAAHQVKFVLIALTIEVFFGGGGFGKEVSHTSDTPQISLPAKTTTTYSIFDIPLRHTSTDIGYTGYK